MIKVTREETSDFSWWLNITSVARLCIGKKKIGMFERSQEEEGDIFLANKNHS